MGKLDPTLSYLSWCHSQGQLGRIGDDVDADRPTAGDR